MIRLYQPSLAAVGSGAELGNKVLSIRGCCNELIDASSFKCWITAVQTNEHRDKEKLLFGMNT